MVEGYRIESYSDGWAVYHKVPEVKKDYLVCQFDHNDEDLGTEAIRQLIEYMGQPAVIEEIC